MDSPRKLPKLWHVDRTSTPSRESFWDDAEPFGRKPLAEALVNRIDVTKKHGPQTDRLLRLALAYCRTALVSIGARALPSRNPGGRLSRQTPRARGAPWTEGEGT